MHHVLFSLGRICRKVRIAFNTGRSRHTSYTVKELPLCLSRTSVHIARSQTILRQVGLLRGNYWTTRKNRDLRVHQEHCFWRSCPSSANWVICELLAGACSDKLPIVGKLSNLRNCPSSAAATRRIHCTIDLLRGMRPGSGCPAAIQTLRAQLFGMFTRG